MAAPQSAALADGLVLGGSYVLVFTAVDATDGSLVSGVSVSDVSVQGDDFGTDDVATVTLPEALIAFAPTTNV